MKLPAMLSLVLSVLCSIAFTEAAGQPKNSVLLRNIKSLTLYKDRKTTHRRVSAIPQLHCIGGSGKGHYEIDVLRCTNSGSSYDEDNIDWTCKASLPPEFKLGSTDVICEGYSNPDDPYILKGSCGVEYRLVLTELGEEKYGRKGWFSSKPGKAESHSAYEEPKSEAFFNFIFWCLFIGVGLWIAYTFLTSLFRNDGTGGQRRGPRAGGGGGGWGGDDGNDPPPPYDPRPPRQPSSKSRSSPRTSSSSQRSSERFQPGFFTGLATGATAAYAANRFGGNRTEQQARQQENRWFNMGGNDNAGEGSSRSQRGQSSSDAPSSSRYESTGFGSTTRR